MGVVNLFGDMTYEGGASINGPFLGTLGASAATISIIAGVGEFLGYSLRSLSGYVADKTGKHWPVTFVGYAINLLAVPAMALAPSWQVAGVFILADASGARYASPPWTHGCRRKSGARATVRRDRPPGQRRVADDEDALRRIFVKFQRWQTLRCGLQLLGFSVALWGVVAYVAIH